MTFPRAHYRPEYSIPGRDTPRAIAQATLLTCAPGFRAEDWTAERLAKACNLRVETADAMLKTRRGE